MPHLDRMSPEAVASRERQQRRMRSAVQRVGIGPTLEVIELLLNNGAVAEQISAATSHPAMHHLARIRQTGIIKGDVEELHRFGRLLLNSAAILCGLEPQRKEASESARQELFREVKRRAEAKTS